MNFLFKLFLISTTFFFISFSTDCAAASQQMTPAELKQFMKEAIVYAVENMDPHMDYGKYVASDYIQHIDGETFNFNQWAQHMRDIKLQMKSQSISFDDAIAEGDKVTIVGTFYGVKKDGSEVSVKMMGIFTIKNHKVVYGDELTHLLTGNAADENIGSLR